MTAAEHTIKEKDGEQKMENAGKLKRNGGEEGDTEQREPSTKMRRNWKDRSTSMKARSCLALKKKKKV